MIEQPLMENVLTDLCIEAEASGLMGIRMAMAFDDYYNTNDVEAQEFFRVGVSVSKYYVTKRLPQFTFECMECMGGNGFVEDFQMARLFRHSPLNSIWEGSGNVIALDVLRGMKSLPHLIKDIQQAKGMDSHFDEYLKSLGIVLHKLSQAAPSTSSLELQRAARNIMDRLSIAMQASILLRFGDPKVMY